MPIRIRSIDKVLPKPWIISSILLGVLITWVIAHYIISPRLFNSPPGAKGERFMSARPPLLIYTVITDMNKPEFQQLERSIRSTVRDSNATLAPDADLFRPIMSPTPINKDGAGFGQKILLLYEALQEVRDRSTLVLFIDGYDVLFGASIDEMVLKYQTMLRQQPAKPLIFGAEMYCWPDEHKIPYYPPPSSESATPSPYRYLNSGTFMGPVSALLDILRPMINTVTVNTDDQRFYTDIYLTGTSPIRLDTQCNLFQCLAIDMKKHVAWDPELERFANTYTGAYPAIFHGNGDGKEFLFNTIAPRLNTPTTVATEEPFVNSGYSSEDSAKTPLPIYIISLEERHQDRLRPLMDRIQPDPRYTIRRIFGVDGKKDVIEGFDLRRGQVGCWLSHVAMWEEIAKSPEPYGLVLEDDANIRLPEQWDALQALIQQLPQGWDMVYLGGRYAHGAQVERVPGTQGIVRSETRMWHAHAYLLTRKAATTLLEQSAAFNHSHYTASYKDTMPVDDWMTHADRKLKIYNADPILVDFTNDSISDTVHIT